MKTRLFAPVLACAFIAVALGVGSSKIKDIDPVGPGVTQNPDCDGMAMFKYKAGETTIHVQLHSFCANTSYGIKVVTDGGSFSDPLAVVTNPGGHGTYETVLPGDATGHPHIIIYVWDGDLDPDSINFVSDSEIRAQGTGISE